MIGFAAAIDAFVARPCKETGRELISRFRKNRSPDAVASLATALAHSGEVLDFHSLRTADVASTGGPSSLSTLLCPLFLVADGCAVPKLGVQGRPAGGIDVMAQLRHFDLTPDSRKVRQIIRKAGYAHFVAGPRHAPADQALFRIRQQLKAQAVPSLVVASILAKKLAVGVRIAGLDVRVFAGGNFGGNVESAKANAGLFAETARILGMKGICFLTDGEFPYQPFIGRLEALAALRQVIDRESCEWLLGHVDECARLASYLVEGRTLRGSADLFARVRVALRDHLEAHGSSEDEFRARAARLGSAPSRSLLAPRSGYPRYDLAEIRRSLVAAQTAAATPFADPCGIVLLKHPSERVERGEPILRVRENKGFAIGGTARWFTISPLPKVRRETIFT